MCCFITTHETSYKVRAVDSSGLKQNNPIFKIRLANTYIQHLNILHHPFSHWKESTMASEDRNYTKNYWNINLFTQQPTPRNQNIEHKHLPNKLGHDGHRACYSDLPRLLITSGCRVNNASSAGKDGHLVRDQICKAIHTLMTHMFCWISLANRPWI